MSGAERRVAGTTWPPRRTLVLCATQRTGSTLACDALTATGLLGYPKEPFAAAAIGPCAEAWGVPTPDRDAGAYLRAALTNGTSPNGICALKVMWEDVPTVATTVGQTPERALAAFTDPAALLVTRRDRLGAAISQHRAERTGEWSTSTVDGRPEPGAPDLDRVSVLHDAQHDHADRWHDLVRASGLPCAEVVYEDVAAEPWRIAEVAASLVDVDLGGPAPVETSLRVQRDDWNEQVRAAWIAATGGCPRCPVA